MVVPTPSTLENNSLLSSQPPSASKNDTQSPPPRSGGGSGDWLYTLMKVATGSVFTAIAMLYIQPKLMFTDFLVELLSKTLEENMLHKLKVDHYVPTPTVKKLGLEPQPYHQTLVCGLRGVGKSTAVYKAMKGKSGVIHVALNSCNAETFCSSVLAYLSFKHHEIPNKVLLVKALEKIQTRKGNKPTFIEEVNEKCSVKELTSLLLVLKDWGSDRKLARFIVVLLTSPAALLLPIPLVELRVMVQSVEDPPEDTIKCYFEQRFAKCKNSTEYVSSSDQSSRTAGCLKVRSN